MLFRCALCDHLEETPVRPALCPCGALDSFLTVESRSQVPAPTLASLEDEAANEPEPPKLSTGIAEVDALLNGGFAEGTSTTLYGPAGTGKSTLALKLAASLGPTLVVCPEMSRAILAQTARRAGANLARLFRAPEPEEWRAHTSGRRVVLVDSISRMRSPLDTLNHATEWAQRSEGVAILLVHLNRDGDPRGGSGVDHDPDCLLRLERDDSGALVLTSEKCRWAPTGSVTLR